MDFAVASDLMAWKEGEQGEKEEKKKHNEKFANDQRDLKHIYEEKRPPLAPFKSDTTLPCVDEQGEEK